MAAHAGTPQLGMHLVWVVYSSEFISVLINTFCFFADFGLIQQQLDIYYPGFSLGDEESYRVGFAHQPIHRSATSHYDRHPKESCTQFPGTQREHFHRTDPRFYWHVCETFSLGFEQQFGHGDNPELNGTLVTFEVSFPLDQCIR